MMNYDDSLKRTDAIEWLVTHYDYFPTEIKVEVAKGIGPTLFKDWRFVMTLEGELLFANCLQPGISEHDFELYHKQVMYV